MRHERRLSYLITIGVLLAISALTLGALSPGSASFLGKLVERTPLSVEAASPRASAGGSVIGYWTNVTRPPSPEADWGAAMTYVPELGASLLFGGASSTSWSNDSWAYNSSRMNWIGLDPSPPVPAVRMSTAMVYDPDVGKVVLFGGMSLYGHDVCARNDTWLYDPASNTWTNVTPPISPPLRAWHSMAYDPVTRRVVLFGGLEFRCGFRIPEVSGPKLNDTWVYDARANTWTNVTRGFAPPGRYGAGFAYDPPRQAFLLFGGAPRDPWSSGTRVLADTWVFDPGSFTWTELHLDHAPSARYGQGMAYDDVAQAVVLYGGCGADVCYRDTWWFNSTADNWTEMPSAQTPDFAPGSVFAFDLNGVLVAYGESETWQYHVARGVEHFAASAFTNVTSTMVLTPVAFRSVVSGGVGPYGYLWSFGDGGLSQEANPNYTYLKPGEYDVILNVTDATGASTVASLRVSVAAPAAPLSWILVGVTASIVLAAGAGVGFWWWLRARRARLEEGHT